MLYVESQGNVATGFVMVDMVGPARQTDVVRGYSYRQILTRPVVGGGFVTALAVPLIDTWGLSIAPSGRSALSTQVNSLARSVSHAGQCSRVSGNP